MHFITKDKTNLKYILIIIVLAVIISASILSLQQRVLKNQALMVKITTNESKEVKENKEIKEGEENKDMSGIGVEIEEEIENFDWKNYKIDISSWLVFKNNKHHYQIKYPKGAIISSIPKALHLPAEDLLLSDKVNIRLPSSRVSGTMINENLLIEAVKNSKKISGEEWVLEMITESKKEYDTDQVPYAWTPTEEESILINNIPAYRVVTFGFDGYYESVYIPKGELIYILGSYPIAEENPNYSYTMELYKVYTAIISTFEFVE